MIYGVASFLWKWEFFFLSLWPSYGERHHCFCVCGCVNVPVWVCACHAAFEATRFYNVSESSPLARELCDGPTCNEVESSTNQWIGETHATPLMIHRHLTSFRLLKTLFCLQALCRRTSATMCLAVWRRSSSSVALATGTAVTTGNQCVGQTGSSTRTSVRWRCLPVETGHASNRFLCPSVLTVRALSHIIWHHLDFGLTTVRLHNSLMLLLAQL